MQHFYAHFPVRQKHVNFVRVHQTEHCPSEYGVIMQTLQNGFWLSSGFSY